jgi:T5SS/PEP-CTERM-associated repeat protein
MVGHRLCCLLSALLWGLALFPLPLRAALVQTGDVVPDISTWTSSIHGHVGNTDVGSVTVDGGSVLTAGTSSLGFLFNSIGAATIAGAGSQWTSNGPLYVGRDGTGFVDVVSGGNLVVNSNTYMGGGPLSTGTVTISGVGSQWNNDAELYIGVSGSGTVVTEEGGQVSISARVALGLNPGSIGTAIVTGAGSTWTMNTFRRNELFVGGSGRGSLTIEAGGQVSNEDSYLGSASGSTGIATITGAGSKWTSSSQLYVGSSGSGTLTIEAGGQVSNGFGYIGDNSGSTGTATVTGAGSKWTNHASLEIGRSGSGTLTVTDGGEVEATQLYASISDLIGNGTISATKGAVLDADLMFDATHGTQQDLPFGSGGTLTVNWNSGTLGVGYKQEGSLTVSDGVEVLTEFGHLGYRSGSTGTATVTGAGSKWTNSISLTVGEGGGSGTLTIEGGGQVTTVEGFLGRGNASTCSGTATVTGVGSQWTNSDSFFVGYTHGGTLTIEAGGQVSNTTGYLGRDSDSTGTAAVTGVSSKWTSDGYLYVGYDGSGSLTISGGGLVTAGALAIDTDSDGDSFINMATGGMLALFGNADDSLSQFLSLVDGTDAIRHWDATLADWSPLTAATYGEDYTLSYLTEGDLAGYTLLTVGRVGDFDNDDDIDGRDLLAWQRNPSLGSLNDWQDQYGNESLAAATVVPEPGSLSLAFGLIVASCIARPK